MSADPDAAAEAIELAQSMYVSASSIACEVYRLTKTHLDSSTTAADMQP